MSEPREPPSPAGAPLVGNTLAYARDQFGFIRDAREACGDVFRADLLGIGEICYLTHPDHFERVLATDRGAFGKGEVLRTALGEGLLAVDGDRWRRQRAAHEEFFTPARIRSYADTIVRLTERRIDRWRPGETRSLLDEMTALTLEVIFGTLFDRELDPETDRELRAAAADLNSYFAPTALVLPDWLPTPARRRFRRADRTLREALRDLLAERSGARAGEPGERTDLLSALAAAEGADEEAVVDQLVTVLFAGHETTALALTYAFHGLGRDPAVRERFHGELDAVLGGDPPGLADVTEFAVTDRIVRETLRLYPPAHTIPRQTTEPVDIGGYRLPEGTQTHLALHSVHRDGRFYEDPLTFDPGRWRGTDPESKGYAYVPFGAGPRTCIGRRFALLETRLILAAVGRRFRLDPQEPIEVVPMMSTQPAGDVPVTVRARE